MRKPFVAVKLSMDWAQAVGRVTLELYPVKAGYRSGDLFYMLTDESFHGVLSDDLILHQCHEEG